MLMMYAQAHVVSKQSWTTLHTIFIYFFHVEEVYLILALCFG
jgi:hypothetical protein